ncbi:hypothetical protein DFA_03681 [Cavenderia fasciculata]|uniref:phosphatidate phosphatase n=1 Tax=Cavenderia fasciculata TaxID=261658 RepID=F4Q1P4_CACFS|nr:uncharacterized protein DFA_03681 [Cavenderia fasciculata]EGG18194.1 hypothetical protein DFA_03681 [Cavenderia fasciculata]|eukprot:XP_004357017.1 hypothetical protein DFA_03681 [Cavenderia fasciculata]
MENSTFCDESSHLVVPTTIAIALIIVVVFLIYTYVKVKEYFDEIYNGSVGCRMNYVEKFVDGVHYVFNLNAATLSGAIDILVIPQPDGTLKCTPFHVRFGKLQLISSSEKVVQIYVNQKKADLQMKLGHAGEAFFVEETEDPVPSILATSPITSPKPGRIIKQSTEELVPEFTSTRIMTRPIIKPTPTTPAAVVTTTTTATTVPATPTEKPVVLTDAIQEMIIAQHKQSQSQDKDKSKPTTTTGFKPITTATTTTSPTTPTKKNQVDPKRTSSPIYFEGSEDITMDSPLNSFIINCEAEQLSPPQPQDSQSPVGSLSPPKPMEMLPNPSASAIASEGSSTSDTESEPKVGFWRWGGLPIFRRNKQPASSAIVAPTTATVATLPNTTGPSSPSTTTTTTMTTTTLTTSTTTTSAASSSLPSQLPSSLSSSSLTGSTKSASATVNQSKLSDNFDQDSSSGISGTSLSTPTSPQQQQEIVLESSSTILTTSTSSTNNIPVVGMTTTSETSDSDQASNSSSNEDTATISGDGSSWSRMGFLTKMFNKKEAEPSFLVKSMDSPPPSIMDSETKAYNSTDQSIIDSSNITTLHINNTNIRNSEGESGIFLLDEDEEEEESRIKELNDDQDNNKSTTTTIVVDNNNDNNSNNNVNNQSPQESSHIYDVSADKSFAAIVKENLNGKSTLERSPSPLVQLDEHEFPSLNMNGNHHNNHMIPIPTPNNTPSNSTLANVTYSSSPNSSFASKANHHNHIEHLAMKQKQTTGNSRPSSPVPLTATTTTTTTTNAAAVTSTSNATSATSAVAITTTITSPLTKEETESLPIVKLSLCGHLILDRSLQSDWPEEREKFFNEHIVTFEQLCNDAGIFKNPHLVAKIGVEFYPWSVAGHIIMTQIVFNRSLPKESIECLVTKDKDERQITKPTTAGSKQSWKSWLSWKSTTTSATQQPGIVVSGAVVDTNNKIPTTAGTTSPPIGSINPTTNTDVIVTQKGSSGYIKKSLRPTSDQLKALGLQKGANRITFVVSSTLQGTREVSASVYFWDNTSKIVISDIDGTITKSDALGQVLPLIGKDWSHLGVAELYSNIKENGYNIMYLTSRAIGQAGLTRTYISSVKQSSSSNFTIATK